MMSEIEKLRMRKLCGKFCLDTKIYGNDYPTMIKDCKLAAKVNVSGKNG